MDAKRVNWFVRILIIILCLFIGFLLCYNFFFTEPLGAISSGVILLLLLLVILVLSEAFDNFSIIKLFSLSKTVKDKDKENTALKKENSDLRNQIVSISTNVCQKQVNSTFVLSDELAKMLSVRPADEPEKEEKLKTEEQEEKTSQLSDSSIKYTNDIRRATSTYEAIALDKLLKTEGLDQFPIIQEAKFTNLFQQIDPISESSPIYDGYIKTMDAEIFIETKMNYNSPMMRDRIYMMLSKIHHYRAVKRVNAFLYLVLINREEKDPKNYRSYTYNDRVLKDFEPAIANGLLRVKEYNISDKELERKIKSQELYPPRN